MKVGKHQFTQLWAVSKHDYQQNQDLLSKCLKKQSYYKCYIENLQKI